MQAILSSHRRRAMAASALALALVAALGLSAVMATAAKRQPRRAATARVAIKGFSYRPSTLRIRRGTKVVFVNRDRAPHTATKRGRGGFDTGRIRGGRAAAVRFKRRGVYRYICTIHPFMRGKIVVR